MPSNYEPLIPPTNQRQRIFIHCPTSGSVAPLGSVKRCRVPHRNASAGRHFERWSLCEPLPAHYIHMVFYLPVPPFPSSCCGGTLSKPASQTKSGRQSVHYNKLGNVAHAKSTDSSSLSGLRTPGNPFEFKRL